MTHTLNTVILGRDVTITYWSSGNSATCRVTFDGREISDSSESASDFWNGDHLGLTGAALSRWIARRLRERAESEVAWYIDSLHDRVAELNAEAADATAVDAELASKHAALHAALRAGQKLALAEARRAGLTGKAAKAAALEWYKSARAAVGMAG